MNVGSVNTTVQAVPAAGKPCVACYAEHREKQIAQAGPASAAYRLDPPPSETLRAVIEAQAADNAGATRKDPAGLTKEEQSVVDQLRARDREVRDHEQAHARVGGAYAGEPSYTYQTGPDGNRYAIGGEVAIDIAPIEGDPEATIQKMEVVKAAALAPAEPSGQDRKVAALADAQKMQAIADLAELRRAVNEAPTERALDLVA
jgi:hypothetical protein